MFKPKVSLKYPGDTKVLFTRNQANGLQVIVDKGIITVKGVPGQDPAKSFTACGSLECSAIRVAGFDRKAMIARAKSLGFLNIPDVRRNAGKAKVCKSHGANAAHHKAEVQGTDGAAAPAAAGAEPAAPGG